MTQIQTFIQKNTPQFSKYKKYISENDWRTLVWNEVGKPKSDVDVRKDEFTVQNQLVEAILNRLTLFVKRNQADQHLQDFKDFVKESLSIINYHTDRADDYISESNLAEIEDTDLRANEIAFHNILFKAISSIDDKITALNIKEDASETSGISFLNDRVAPLSMHKVLSEIYPEINVKLENMGIDFTTPPNNELHIHNPNPPEWNASKHYWEQDPYTLQYYVDEFKKLENGILIDGYYMSGWMYYHINVFVTPIPHEVFNEISKQYESKDKIINPPLRDSDVNIFENHEDAKKSKTSFITFIAATRRAAKTTLESSKLGHAATIGKKELLCAGGSTKDLNQISKNFKTDLQYKNAAFSVYNVTNDWKDKIELGLKTKANKTILLSTLYIVNTDSGNNPEILAGFTPDEFVYDEVGKASFIEPLEGLKPALKGSNGLIRCYPILSGTGGDSALSADAMIVLNNPESNDVLPMNWELLERGVPEEYKTWVEDKMKPFGTFIPGQMCVDMPKFESNLGDYIGRPDSQALKNIKLKVTDWENATKKIEETRDKKKGNKVAYMKEVVYIPIKPSEIFMSGKQNPFPVNEAKAHKQYLLESGLWDRRRELYRDSQGKIQARISTKPLAEYPHKGGIVDAPALIFEDFPEVKPKFGTYTAGFDATKQDDSATTSVLTFYVMKNKILGDPFSEKIVASISFRPEKKEMAYEQWLMLMEAYGLDGTCFGENEDYTIKDYLDRFKLADKYLAQSLDFSQTFSIPNNLKRKTGWNPSTTKRTLHGLFVDYCNEVFEVEDENGVKIIIKGVQRIDDIGLLDEIINWTEHANTDRLIAAYGAYGFLHYLNSSFLWKVEEKRKEQDEFLKPKPPHQKKIFGGSPRRRGILR